MDRRRLLARQRADDARKRAAAEVDNRHLTDGREDRRIVGEHDAVAYDQQGRLLRITRDGAVLEDATKGPKQIPLHSWGADTVVVDRASNEIWLSSWSGWFEMLGHPADAEQRHATWHVADMVVDGDRVITIGPDEQISSWPRRPKNQKADVPQVLFGVRHVNTTSMAFVGEEVAVALETGDVRLVGAAPKITRALPRAVCKDPGRADADDVAVTPELLSTRTLRVGGTDVVSLVGGAGVGAVRWNLATGALTCPKRWLESPGDVVGVTPDGRGVILGIAEGELWVGDTKKKVKASESSVDEAVLVGDSDASVAVYVDDDGTHAVRASDGAVLGTTRDANLAALPGGRVLLGRWPMAVPKSDDDDDARLAIAVWTPGKGPPQVVTQEHTWTNQLIASPDGKRFLHTTDREVWLRETSTGVVQTVVQGAHVEALAFAADGQRFAVCVGGVVTVYDLEGHVLWSRDARPPG